MHIFVKHDEFNPDLNKMGDWESYITEKIVQQEKFYDELKEKKCDFFLWISHIDLTNRGMSGSASINLSPKGLCSMVRDINRFIEQQTNGKNSIKIIENQ